MEKNIKDYLHLYLGCECEHNSWEIGRDEVPTYFSQGRKISNLDEGMLSESELFEIKPILRPLSDMTEEEAVEVAKESEWTPHFRDVKVERNRFGDIIVSWDGMAESREEFNATGEMFYCSEQFIYLLSKHFDLFNLIESGLALDATKAKVKESDLSEDER